MIASVTAPVTGHEKEYTMTVVRCQCIWFSLVFAGFAMDLDVGFAIVLSGLFGHVKIYFPLSRLGVCQSYNVPLVQGAFQIWGEFLNLQTL